MIKAQRACGFALFFMLIGIASAFSDVSFLIPGSQNSFRLMVYNSYWNSIFETGVRRYGKAAEFRRVLRAIQPDILCLQEIGPERDREEIAEIIRTVLPPNDGESWHLASGADNVIVSRFPIRWWSGEVVYGRGNSRRGHVIALIDLPDGAHTRDALISSAHFISGGSRSEIAARTVHADALVEYIRSGIRSGGVPDGVPVILAGDFNAYGTDPRRHIDTLIHGDISDEKRYGEDGSLDPNGEAMVDLLPTHNAQGEETWTWRDDTQQFAPYPLDRILYSGTVLNAVHSFVLNTDIMSREDLTSSGLSKGDIALNLSVGDFDHLPLVADFAFR